MFDGPLYLMSAHKYNKRIQARCHYTLSKGGIHLTSLFQSQPSNYYYGDRGNDALLVLIDDDQMEIYLFQDQRKFAEAYCISAAKLPLLEIKLKAQPVYRERFERQLICKQLVLI